MDVVYFLLWWLGLAALGWIALFLFQPTLKSLSGQGYFAAKAIGLLLLSWLAWIAAATPVIPFTSTTVIAISLLLAALAIYLVNSRQTKLSDIPWLLFAKQEAIFFTALAAWSIVRSYNPRIEGVEKFMNIAFINAILRTDHFPTIDPWYAGESINYYYFGHLMMANLIKLTQVPAQFGFNLGVATIFALTVTISAAFVFTLSRSKMAALTTAFLIALSSNLDPAINLIKQTKDYIFFSATRLDPYTINEFPLYSFVIADLHAHTLNLPTTLVIICLLYVAHQSIRLSWALVFLLALTIGATAPTNAFDALIYGGLTGLVLVHRSLSQHGWNLLGLRVGLQNTILIGLASVVLYLPFYLNFHNPTGGVGVDLFKTPLSHLAINFGAMLLISLPLLPHLIPQLKKLQLIPSKTTPKDAYIILLFICAIGFIVFTEFFFMKDIYNYENPPYARANTIFKIYYQVWVLLAIVAGYGLAIGQKYTLKRGLTDIYIFIFAITISLTAAGTWSAYTSYQQGKSTTDPTWTLDGYAYLQTQDPDQLATINWLNTNVPGHPIMVEAAGDSYTQQSRISSYTGLASPIGWASHEWGWRYSPTSWADNISTRVGFIQQIYAATDPNELSQLLQQYNITYIVYSPEEAAQYMTDDSTIQSLTGQPIFTSGEYKLYHIANAP